MRAGICGFFGLMLTGCGGTYRVAPKLVVDQPVSSVSKETTNSLSEEEKARLYDISFPLSVEPFTIAFTEQYSVVGYCTLDPLEKLVQYHTTDMEYWGWEKQLACLADEACLTFRKPARQCVITLRKEGTHVRVVLFIAYSSGGNSSE